MQYLLDTDICIYLIKHHPPEVLAQFQKHSPGDVAVSAITLFELQYGAQKSRSFRQAENALSKFLNKKDFEIGLKRRSRLQFIRGVKDRLGSKAKHRRSRRQGNGQGAVYALKEPLAAYSPTP